MWYAKVNRRDKVYGLELSRREKYAQLVGNRMSVIFHKNVSIVEDTASCTSSYVAIISQTV